MSVDDTASGAWGSIQQVSRVLSTGQSVDISIHASATGTPSYSPSASAEGRGHISYSMRINGPDWQTVAVKFVAIGSILGLGYLPLDPTDPIPPANAYGKILLGFNEQLWTINSYFAEPVGLYNHYGNDSFSVNKVYNLRTNWNYLIDIYAQGSVSAGSGMAGELNVAEIQIVADPTFSFVNPNDAKTFSFEFSPNIVPPIAKQTNLAPILLLLLYN